MKKPPNPSVSEAAVSASTAVVRYCGCAPSRGIWLVADLEAPYWWTLDVDNMPAVDLAHLHAVTLAEAQVLPYTVEVGEPNPMDTYDGVAGTLGEWADTGKAGATGSGSAATRRPCSGRGSGGAGG